MAFWSGDKLLQEVPLRSIIDPYDPAKIDCSAFTLTLGPESFVSPDFTISARQSVKTPLAPASTINLGGGQRKIAGGELVIPPGQFALLLTEEFVRIPHDAMGFISLKFGVKGPGLINVSGFHVDPGYEGRLVFSVYNAGPESSHLHRGQDVFLLWLADLDRTSSAQYVKPPATNPMVSIPLDLVSRADAPIHSLQQLSERIEGLHREVGVIKTLAKYIGGLIALAAGIVAIVAYFAPDDAQQNAPEPAAIVDDADPDTTPELPPPAESPSGSKTPAGEVPGAAEE
jgi:dCTP deaminase